MTSKYRTLNNGNNVDESLFGDLKGKMSGNPQNGSGKLRTLSAGQKTFISRDELSRIKHEAIIKTEAELIADREHAMKIKEEKDRLSKERKTRMKELEQIAIQKAKKSDEEIAKMAKDQALRDAAAIKMDGYSDVVKALASMSCRAAAFTMREQQLEEKKVREEAEEEYNRRMDMVMEIDRLKELQRREAEDIEKRAKRIADRKIITDQMEQRQRIKVLAAEAREQENQAMRSLMKKYQEEDSSAAARRAIEQEKSRASVVAANTLAIERKKEYAMIEQREQEDILIYQAQKDAEFARREEEEIAVAKAKKERQMLLLAQQERAANNAGKMDEIRARRAAEERERRARKKDKEDAERKKAAIDELLVSRAAQAAHKAQQLEKAKEDEAIEQRDALQFMQRMAQRETLEARKKQELAVTNKSAVLQQIESREKVSQSAVHEKNAVGLKLRQQVVADEAKFTVIRDTMVRELEKEGVNPRFLSEMTNVDVGKFMRR